MQGQVRLSQQSAGTFHVHPAYLTQDAPSQHLSEPALRERRDVAISRGRFRYPDGLMALLADETHGSHDIGIVHGQDVRGSAGDYAQRRQEQGRASLLLPSKGDPPPSPLHNRSLGWQGNTGERGTGKFAQQIIVVHAENGHVLRYLQAGVKAHLGELDSPDVVGSEDTHRDAGKERTQRSRSGPAQ